MSLEPMFLQFLGSGRPLLSLEHAQDNKCGCKNNHWDICVRAAFFVEMAKHQAKREVDLVNLQMISHKLKLFLMMPRLFKLE